MSAKAGVFRQDQRPILSSSDHCI